MANVFVDYAGGNDANNGSSFSLRKKTIQSAFTVALAGDNVLLMKSPDQINTGLNGTFTNQGSTVTASSSSNWATVFACGSSFTAKTNVTCTTSSTRKEGTLSSSFSTNSSLAGGAQVLGTVATGTLNLSSFQQLTFWIMYNTSGQLATGQLQVQLCTDTLGATPVHTFTINQALNFGQWTPITIDNGSSLNSSIKSIAIKSTATFRSKAFLIDNIMAVIAPASAAAITLQSLIGTNDGNWYPVRSMSGTTITLDNYPIGTPLNGNRGFTGTSGTVALYRRETIKTAVQATATTASHTFSGSAGTSTNPITVSGGWDTTSMSSQTGETYYDGLDGFGNVSITTKGFSTSKVSFVRYNQALLSSTDLTTVLGGSFIAFNPSANGSISSATSFTASGLIVNLGRGNGIGLTATPVQLNVGSSGLTVLGANGYGIQFSSGANFFSSPPTGTVTISNNFIGGLVGQGTGLNLSGTNIFKDNGSTTISSCFGIINNFTANGNVIDTPKGNIVINGLSGNLGNPAIYQPGVSIYVFKPGTINRIGKLPFDSSATFSGPTGDGVFIQDSAGVAGDIKQLISTGTIINVSSPTHGSTSRSFQCSPNAFGTNQYTPLRFEFPPIAVKSSTVTVSIWVQPSDNNIKATLRVLGYKVAGVSEVSTTLQGGSGTMQKLSLTVSPTEKGILHVVLDVYNSSTANVVIGDLAVA